MKEIAILKYLGYIWSVFMFLKIPQFQFSVLSIFMACDFILWIAKHYVLDAKNITSHNAIVGIIKKWSIIMLVLLLWLGAKANNIDLSSYMIAFLGGLIASELYSIVGHIYTIRTKEILPEFDAISIALKKLWEIIKKILEKTLFIKK